MPDVLTITAELDDRSYPSKNHEGKDSFRGGRKSDVYLALSAKVRENAEAEIARTGWECATCPVLAVVVLYVPDRLRRDAFNIGGAEANALTAARAWQDDSLATIVLKHIAVAPGGPLRVAIVIAKLYEPLFLQPRSAAKQRAKKPKPVPTPAEQLLRALKKSGRVFPKRNI